MGKVTVKTKDGKAELYTPYSQDFVTKVRNIGGARWSGKAWAIPEESLERAREIMIECYGESDLEVADMVDVKLTVVAEEVSIKHAGGTAFGKTIAKATGRDSGAWVCQDVELISGKIRSGGSVKNWRTEIDKGAVFALHSVPVSLLENAESDWYEFEVLEKKQNNRHSDLLKEREKLAARIAEIDAELAGMDKKTQQS